MDKMSCDLALDKRSVAAIWPVIARQSGYVVVGDLWVSLESLGWLAPRLLYDSAHVCACRG
jgi:hypothetical protein